MKNITLSADEHLIETAREAARAKHTTLNQMFREWLDSLARERKLDDYDTLMRDIRASGVSAGRKFTREEMNAREAMNER